MMNFTSTIAAISTPPGKGGVAVIRISGDEALSVAEKMFKPKGSLKDFKNVPRRQIWGDILSCGEVIDDGLICYFPAPFSYTGEDVIEISCHGGILITRCVLEAALSCGAALAEAGEFTRRAFTNGKLTLTEAEAIGMLLDAEGMGQIRLGRAASRERLSEKISEIHTALLSLMSSIYARIDYPDEDLGDFTDSEAKDILKSAKMEIEALIATYKVGRAVKAGVKTVIAGCPNVGKSTLYNALTEDESAIVTDIPGTTRDILECSVPVGNIILRISDTAGIRDNVTDKVEAIGVERSKKRIEESELIFTLFNSSEPLCKEDIELIRLQSGSSAAKIAVLTMQDRGVCDEFDKEFAGYENLFDAVIRISARLHPTEAKATVAQVVTSLFEEENITVGTDAIISSANQYASLVKALEHVNSALIAYTSGLTQDIASADVELALSELSMLDGRGVCEELVSDIFSKFCVGK